MPDPEAVNTLCERCCETPVKDARLCSICEYIVEARRYARGAILLACLCLVGTILNQYIHGPLVCSFIFCCLSGLLTGLSLFLSWKAHFFDTHSIRRRKP